MAWFYYVGQLIITIPGLFFFTRYRAKGVENVPKKGALIVVANHLSYADPPLLSTIIHRRIVFMAKEELFSHPILGPLTRGWRSIPVRRDKLDREAIRHAQEVLERGMLLGLFPESKRSANAQLQPAYNGAALIALRSGAAILPIAITGSEKVSKNSFLFHRPQVLATIGQPFNLPSSGSKPTKDQLAATTDFIMRRIAELLPESYRGYYGDKEGD